MLGAVKAIFSGWAIMAALIMGMRMVMISIWQPPLPHRLQVAFEFAHLTIAGVIGGWVCAKAAPDAPLVCATVLAIVIAGLELISLRRGWTTYHFAHSVAGIIAAPVAVVISAMWMG